MTRTVRRQLGLLLAAATTVVFVGWASYALSRWTPSVVDADRIAAVEVWLHYEVDKSGEASGPARMLARCDNPAAIRELLVAMARPEAAPQHKCGFPGRFVFVRKDGERATVEFVPGHDPRFYEFGHRDELARVPRAEFLAAVKDLGVADFPLECQKPLSPLP
jgi:hypothetical protein